MDGLMNSLPDKERCQLRDDGGEQAGPASDQRANDQRQDREIADDHIEKRRMTSGLGEALSRLSHSRKKMKQSSFQKKP
jgi:hypothetical protein